MLSNMTTDAGGQGIFRLGRTHFVCIIGLVLFNSTPSAACPEFTDADYIRAGVQSIVENPSFNLLSLPLHEARRIRSMVVPYETVDAFLAANPECCRVSRVGRDGFQLPLLKRIMKDFETFILIDYSVQVRTDTRLQLFRVQGTEVALSSCGEIIELN